MSNRILLLFNHRLTAEQRSDAENALGVSIFQEPPPDLGNLWAHVPPDVEELDDYLAPIRSWLQETAEPGDFVLIQGDFGATWMMVRFALEQGLVPLYATTRREAAETPQPDGSVILTHRFKHVRFRRYGS